MNSFNDHINFCFLWVLFIHPLPFVKDLAPSSKAQNINVILLNFIFRTLHIIFCRGPNLFSLHHLLLSTTHIFLNLPQQPINLIINNLSLYKLPKPSINLLTLIQLLSLFWPTFNKNITQTYQTAQNLQPGPHTLFVHIALNLMRICSFC